MLIAMKDKSASRSASELGKLGGAARAKKLTPRQRSEIARKAANARWGKEKGP